MGKVGGFLQLGRGRVAKRPVAERLGDEHEFELLLSDDEIRDQASRCMDCGVPFCHSACPLGNLIPDWNDDVWQGRFDDALAALHATNNFPEFTGRVCPAPCEAACVLNMENQPVMIKHVERTIIDKAFESGLVGPILPTRRTHRSIAVVGSGPAGLAAAQELARKGHDVTVFERDDRIGGLLRYGIPDFKMEKYLIDRRIDQMKAEGVTFVTGVDVGVHITADELRRRYDAVVLCGGARKPRDLDVPGRDLAGVHFAMEFLTEQNRRNAGDALDKEPILATDRRVVIVGGGDTGADCLGTSHRQRALRVMQLEILPRPPDARLATNPWPAWPLVLRTSSSHEEGGQREWAVMTTRLLGDANGRVRALVATRVDIREGRPVVLPGTEFEIPCELVLLAMGFVGPEREGLLAQLGVELDARGNVKTHDGRTSVPGVFAAGDVSRGQSLVVWAIAEGRKAADAVDAYLAASSARLDQAG